MEPKITFILLTIVDFILKKPKSLELIYGGTE